MIRRTKKDVHRPFFMDLHGNGGRATPSLPLWGASPEGEAILAPPLGELARSA